MITVTDPEMTRFFLNLRDVIELVLEVPKRAVGGEIFVLDMPAMRIADLSQVMMHCLGDSATTCTVIGKRPGEKVHEILVSSDERERTYRLGSLLRPAADDPHPPPRGEVRPVDPGAGGVHGVLVGPRSAARPPPDRGHAPSGGVARPDFSPE